MFAHIPFYAWVKASAVVCRINLSSKLKLALCLVRKFLIFVDILPLFITIILSKSCSRTNFIKMWMHFHLSKHILMFDAFVLCVYLCLCHNVDGSSRPTPGHSLNNTYSWKYRPKSNVSVSASRGVIKLWHIWWKAFSLFLGLIFSNVYTPQPKTSLQYM